MRSDRNEEPKGSTRITRRELLRAGALVSAGLVLGACGKAAAPLSRATQGKATPTTAPPATKKPTVSGTSPTLPAPTSAGTPAPAATAATVAPTGTAGPSVALSKLAPVASPTVYSGKPTGGEFHGGWPYTPPPQGQFNTFIANALPSAIGIYYGLQEMPLAMYNWSTAEYYPMLATGWEVLPPNQFRVHLRQGVRWSDGKPFSARDVVTTFMITWMQVYDLWNYLGDVKAEDDHTVLFTMKKPSSVVPYYVLEMNVRADSVYGQWGRRARALFDKGLKASSKEVGKLNTQFSAYKLKDAPVSGPYKIDVPTITSAQLVLKKVPTAWNADQVNFDTIVIYNGETPTITPLVLSRKVDYATHGFPLAVMRQFAKSGIKLVNPPVLSGPAVYFNLKRVPEMSDPRVRQAIAYAIDKKQNADVAYGMGSGLATRYMMTGVADEIITHWMSSGDLAAINPYTYDPDKAAALLAKAGWKKQGKSWHTPQGKPARYEMIFPAEYTDWAAAGTNAAEQLSKFGIRTTVRSITFTAYADQFGKGDFELGINAWGTGNPHPYFSYVLDLFSNNTEAPGGGMHFPLKQKVPGMGEVDLRSLVIKSAEGLQADEQKQTVTQLAKAYDYLLPQVPLAERYGGCAVLEGVRVTGWPPMSDPLWKQPVYNDSFVVLWILDGTLRGVKH